MQGFDQKSPITLQRPFISVIISGNTEIMVTHHKLLEWSRLQEYCGHYKCCRVLERFLIEASHKSQQSSQNLASPPVPIIIFRPAKYKSLIFSKSRQHGESSILCLTQTQKYWLKIYFLLYPASFPHRCLISTTIYQANNNSFFVCFFISKHPFFSWGSIFCSIWQDGVFFCFHFLVKRKFS
jgi:hypothetical protein